MPPIIQTYNPLGEGLDAAASAIQGGNDARDKALALARAREQQLYDRSEDQKRDKTTQDEFDERKSEFGATHALDVQSTEANIAHTQHQDRISDAVERTRQVMAPLLLQAQALQNKRDTGLISQDQLRSQGLAIALQTQRAQAALEAEFGKPMAQMALAQAEANYASTQAGTASTNASTARTNALLPYDTAQASLNLTGSDLLNTGRALQNRASFEDLQSNTNTPLHKQLDADYKSALTSFTSRSNTYDRLAAQGRAPKGPDGKTLPPPAEPTSPEDFTAKVAGEIDNIKAGKDSYGRPVTVASALAEIQNQLRSGALSDYQARLATQQITAATQSISREDALRRTRFPNATNPLGSSIGGQAFGGPGAGTSPFSQSQLQPPGGTGFP